MPPRSPDSKSKQAKSKPGAAAHLRKAAAPSADGSHNPELILITGLSGSGKGTMLRCLDDLGFYSVDNLPLELMEKFAELTKDSPNIRRAALVVDVHDARNLERFPAIYAALKRKLRCTLVYLEAERDIIVRRFSETRRPHPLGTERSVTRSVLMEREQLSPIRDMADLILDTSRFNVHEFKEVVKEKFSGVHASETIRVYVTSFGYRNGVPHDGDLVFDVRFLPNPNYIPEFKPLTGRNPQVARYIRSFPQTQEFVSRISEMLIYLLPHYIREGKSYLTIAFGCTGGQHRSVFIADEIGKRLKKAGFHVRTTHRDAPDTRKS
ncbi:MAG TPA: RNase adapter RapZ [Bryobacteraceae bacterium]|nr:RNase adapter RapZ [Bryobacteraceae bacterium]